MNKVVIAHCNNKRPSWHTLETYEHVQNFKQDFYCVIPSNRITTGMRWIFCKPKLTNKIQGKWKEKKSQTNLATSPMAVQSKANQSLIISAWYTF